MRVTGVSGADRSRLAEQVAVVFNNMVVDWDARISYASMMLDVGVGRSGSG